MEVMHHLTTCRVLTEYDWPPPQPVRLSPSARIAIGKKMKACSTCSLETSTFNEEQFVDFGSNKHDPLSPEVFRQQGLATMALLKVGASLNKLQDQWINRMLSRSTCIQRVGSPKCYLVAKVSQMGICAVEVFPVRDFAIDGKPFMWFSVSPIDGLHDRAKDDEQVVFLQVDDVRGWRAADVIPRASEEVSTSLRSGSHTTDCGPRNGQGEMGRHSDGQNDQRVMQAVCRLRAFNIRRSLH
jgi:hypothetical protein